MTDNRLDSNVNLILHVNNNQLDQTWETIDDALRSGKNVIVVLSDNNCVDQGWLFNASFNEDYVDNPFNVSVKYGFNNINVVYTTDNPQGYPGYVEK